ncbi:PIR Superfamily Protein [Plasmodium ovale wallikeri]|uniref:PIR protein n=2 Tax=Plasmodium ovale TaxID=36330 RepID=A0A1C3KHA8_PLAOA|nr:PIR Superfamily Protein [Plasmodium ovale wallikeri]SBT73122.1 PIR protein [Plasmodium ovale]
MNGNDLNERFDSFDEYSSNKDTYDSIKTEIGDYYKSFPNEVIPQNTTDREFIVKDCLRLNKYLMEFGSKEKCQTKNCCAYINYLLNYGIRNSYESQNSIFQFYTKYMNDNSNKDIKKLCGAEINNMDKDKYEKTKKLYGLYIVYKGLLSSQTSMTCSRANSCVSIYNNIIADYPDLNDIKFCKALNNFKTVFEDNKVISTNQCHAVHPNGFRLQNACIHPQEQSRDTELHPQQSDGQAKKEEAPGKQSFPEEQQTGKETEEQSSSYSSSGTTVPIAFFSSGIGALLILLSFYKFTPFGQLLRLKIQKFKGTSDHLDGEQYEMQQNYSEYDERNAEYNGYNISYNSL